jgi:hypothetical protein
VNWYEDAARMVDEWRAERLRRKSHRLYTHAQNIMLRSDDLWRRAWDLSPNCDIIDAEVIG